MEQISKDYQSTLENFLYSFTKTVKEFKPEYTIWEGHASTTEFYKSKLFPRIAEDLNLHLRQNEFLRIDFTMDIHIKPNSYPVPIIAIESENISSGNNSDIPKEILKLLSFNSPIKILITRFESLQNEIDSIFDNHENTDWFYIIDTFEKAGRFEGVFIIMSLEQNTSGEWHFAYAVYNSSKINNNKVRIISF